MTSIRSFGSLSVLALLALAGCVGDSGGSARLSFDGTGNSSHSDDTKCDDDGTLLGNGQVDQGQVAIRVTDGDNREMFTRTLDGGFNLEAEKLSGASGTWEITATRMSDGVLQAEFSGDYSFRLAC